MSRKEIINPGHGTPLNREARKYKHQEKNREKKEAKSKNHKNNHQDKWPLAEDDSQYIVPSFFLTGKDLIIEAKDLADGVLPTNVFKVNKKLVS